MNVADHGKRLAHPTVLIKIENSPASFRIELLPSYCMVSIDEAIDFGVNICISLFYHKYFALEDQVLQEDKKQ